MAGASGCPDWCATWQCHGEQWCTHGARPEACTSCCPDWCEQWTCPSGPTGKWCADGATRPPACKACACPTWCNTWTCKGEAWCRDGGLPAACTICEAFAQGPLKSIPQHPRAGWVLDHGDGVRFHDEVLLLKGEGRAYLVQDFEERGWSSHRYIRFDLSEAPLAFDLDVKNVPCGCLACVYLVAMPDPTYSGRSNYCDMANNLKPGLHGGLCTELDILEINSQGAQTAIHTEMGGDWGSGRCDKNGCSRMIGGPHSPHSSGSERELFGPRKMIDSNLPFEVRAEVSSGTGELKVSLVQNGKKVVVFDKHSGGNPPGKGVPGDALRATTASMGKLALVASLWSDTDMTWFDGTGCSKCDLGSASFKVSNVRSIVRPSPPSPMPPPPMPAMPSPQPPPPPPSPSPPSPPSPPNSPPRPASPPRLPMQQPAPPGPPPTSAVSLSDDGFFESFVPHEHPLPPSPSGWLDHPPLPPLPSPGQPTAAATANAIALRAFGAVLGVIALILFCAYTTPWSAALSWTRRRDKRTARSTVGTVFGGVRSVSASTAHFSKLNTHEPDPNQDMEADEIDSDKNNLTRDNAHKRHRPQPRGRRGSHSTQVMRGAATFYEDDDDHDESPPTGGKARCISGGGTVDDIMSIPVAIKSQEPAVSVARDRGASNRLSVAADDSDLD